MSYKALDRPVTLILIALALVLLVAVVAVSRTFKHKVAVISRESNIVNYPLAGLTTAVAPREEVQSGLPAQENLAAQKTPSVRKAVEVVEVPLAEIKRSGPTSLLYTAHNEEAMVAYIMHKNHKVFEDLAHLIAQGVFDASVRYHIAPEVIVGLIDVESDFDCQAVSKAGAIGLMQVNHNVWVNEKNPSIHLINNGILSKLNDLYDPKKNIMAGTHILRYYLDQAESKGKANCLEYAVTRYLGGTNNGHYSLLSKAVISYAYAYQPSGN